MPTTYSIKRNSEYFSEHICKSNKSQQQSLSSRKKGVRNGSLYKMKERLLGKGFGNHNTL